MSLFASFKSTVSVCNPESTLIVLFDPEVTITIPIFWFAVTAPLVPIEKILDEFIGFFNLSFKA